MASDLQSRKRQLVEGAIYDAAIDLFAKRGFDETTIEEVAALGSSRQEARTAKPGATLQGECGKSKEVSPRTLPSLKLQKASTRPAPTCRLFW